MNEKAFTTTAWNCGTHSKTGAGYGIKIDAGDRDNNFDKTWNQAILLLEGESKPIMVNTNKKSFWNATCRELISQEIGLWLINNAKAPWPKQHPPKLIMTHIKDNQFEVRFA